MLKNNSALYHALIKRLPLSELTGLFERSSDYPMLRCVIEREIDERLSHKTMNLKSSRQLVSAVSKQELTSSL
jgi:hypothetical protein